MSLGCLLWTFQGPAQSAAAEANILQHTLSQEHSQEASQRGESAASQLQGVRGASWTLWKTLRIQRQRGPCGRLPCGAFSFTIFFPSGRCLCGNVTFHSLQTHLPAVNSSSEVFYVILSGDLDFK